MRQENLITVSSIVAIFILPTVTGLFAAEAFSIQVVDEASRRGVPLVELKTTSGQTFVTDSAGRVAISDPVLLRRTVFFHVSGHGYEYPQDGFGYRGKALDITPGREAILRIKRLNIAERLYRVTGAGIYRDSATLGKGVPITHPLINAQVTGQDSVQAVVTGKRIFWFWGDTNRLRYPLGNFNTSGATSLLPQAGGLDPNDGVNLQYFANKSGFSRPMFEPEPGILIWIDGLFTVMGPKGEERVVTHFSRRKSLDEQLSHGVAVFNHDTNRFDPIVQLDQKQLVHPRGQSFRQQEDGKEYICFADPYAVTRVQASWDAVIDPNQYEAFTPLSEKSLEAIPENLDRTDAGRLNFDWKSATNPVSASDLQRWVQMKVIDETDNRFRTIDVATGKPISLHRGSIQWNDFRRRWVMIAHELGGKSSFLGEVWYAESKNSTGPFAKAVKIATHNGYSFYNVSHHKFFDQENGKLIYFEGTYTTLFSKTKTPTPLYDYNQIMYRLDMADPRLSSAFIH